MQGFENKMKNLENTFEYLKKFLTAERLAKIENFSKESSNFVLPVMEDVYQFRNAAAIIRSVEACGFHKVVAMESLNIFDPNLTVTKGADNWVEIERMTHTLESLQEIRNRGYKLVAVSPENNATLLPDFEISQPVALIFGTEWQGISEDFLDFCDETLAIPMYGFTKSFNVSVAAAICTYDLKQKLVNSGIDYKLSESQRLEMIIKWAANSIPSGKEILAKYLSEN